MSDEIGKEMGVKFHKPIIAHAGMSGVTHRLELFSRSFARTFLECLS